MKQYLSMSALGLAILFVSCKKVINIDLKNKDPEIMIEGIITDDPAALQTVKITRTVNFSADNVFPAVSGANVVISDNAGNSIPLAETSPGVYQTSALAGVSGRTYYLSIQAEGKTYASFSTMPSRVNLDSIRVETGIGPSDRKVITADYNDPPGRGNYYRFKLMKNNVSSKNIFVSDDQIRDGSGASKRLSDSDLEFETGDSAIVTMMCIDKNVHLYFYSLSQNGSGPNASATPANPVTNIDGATLGYFSAQTTQTKKMVIP